MDFLLLDLLNDARLGRPSHPRICDFSQLFRLAEAHQVSSLIYQQICDFPELPQDLRQRWSREALTAYSFQAMRTHRLLQLLEILRGRGIDVLVVKGLILRILYPQPDNRQSNDEDLCIPLEQMDAATRILQEAGAVLRHTGPYENAFLDPSCGLSIELHGTFFDPEVRILAGYNRLFEDAFQAPAVYEVDGAAVPSLSPDLHLVYLVTHLAKHLLFSGVGIRQVLDIVMFAEAHRTKIDWPQVYRKLDEQNLLTLTANLMAIGRTYFSMEPSVPVPEADPDCRPLLEDILQAGIFGASTQPRLHSAAVTLAAADGQDKITGGLLVSRLFPSRKALENRREFSYLREKPWLLPVAWAKRMEHYFSVRESGTQELETLDLGARRVELLKKYGVIK